MPVLSPARKGSHGKLETALFLAPVGIMFVIGFAFPLVSFLISSIAEIGSFSQIFKAFHTTVLSAPAVASIITTNEIAVAVTVATLLIAYPMAVYLCQASRLRFMLVIFCVIVPYFTSIIVRTYSWMILLGRHGVINSFLLDYGLIDHPLHLLYNRFGVIVGMTFILLPYMVLTLFAAMKNIDRSYMRAAQSLGSSNVYAFCKIYFPLSLNGVIAGCLIVFILSIGFFITPDLMGGAKDVMSAMLIQRAVEIMFDWSSAAIMSIELLVVTMVIYVIYFLVTDPRNRLGG